MRVHTKMSTVAQVLDHKDTSVYTIAPNASVRSAIKLMAEKNIGALIVTNEQKQVIGIISERDYTHKIVLKNRSSLTTNVHEIMTQNVITVTRKMQVDECLQMMTDGHLRHLPVVENNKLLGMVAIGDLVKATMEDQRRLIEQLQHYISG